MILFGPEKLALLGKDNEVLILVVVDDTFWEMVTKQTLKDYEVLILVVVDDTFWACKDWNVK